MAKDTEDRHDSLELEAARAGKDAGNFEHQEITGRPGSQAKLDRHGLPLMPQPSDHKDDPLNWSPAAKFGVLIQISLLALLGNMSAAVINPAFVPLGKAFDISVVQASYELTVFIIFAGVGPLFIVPLSHRYGRRPIYLLGNLLAACTNLAAGFCTTWSGLLATRVFNGVGAGCTIAMGAATICDLYFLHERGLFMGVYTFFLTNGPHLAPLVGGFIAQRLGWEQCFKIPSYVQLAIFAVNLVCLPETLYSRTTNNSLEAPYKQNSYVDLILFKPKHLPSYRIHIRDFAKPFMMLRYVCIFIPGLYYMTAFSFGSVLFAATGSHVFREFYDFNTESTGLMLSIPLLIGCLIGEFNAGWFTDWLVYRDAKKHNNERSPEARLDALWLALLLPVGTIIQGVCISHVDTVGWIGPAFGMGIASFGLQVATTCVYAYTTDCYKPQSPEISSLLNLFRSIFSAFVSFYAIPLADKIDFQYAWLVLGFINIAFLIPLFMLRWWGKKIRMSKWQTPPGYDDEA